MNGEKREFVCMWRVENFSFRSEARHLNEILISPEFQVACLGFPGGMRWKIRFYPREYYPFVTCSLQILNGASEISNALKLNDIWHGKSIPKHVIGYRFEILDIHGVPLCSSSILKLNFQSSNSGDIKTKGLARLMQNFPEDIVIVRCVLMRMKDASFSMDFDSSLENKRADEAKCDCECKTVYGIDRFTCLFKDLASLKGKKVIPTSTPFCVNFRNDTGREIHVTMRGVGNDRIGTFVSCKITSLSQDGTVVEVSNEKPETRYVDGEYDLHVFSIKKEIVHSGFYIKCETKSSNSIRFDKVSYTMARISNVAEISTQTSEEDDILANAPAALTSEGLSNSMPTVKSNANFNLQELVKAVRSPLQEDLYTILINGKLTDVTLKSENVLMPAHKALLAARSPVFSAMFDQDMLESHSGAIYLPDVDVDTLKLFLKYIYTDTVDMNGYEDAIKLMTIADKYQVIPLKEKCSAYLKTVLCHENVCDVIAIADMLNQEDLKSSAMAYIKSNASKILSTSEWTQWLRQNLELSAEIVAIVSSELVNKDCKSSSS